MRNDGWKTGPYATECLIYLDILLEAFPAHHVSHEAPGFQREPTTHMEHKSVAPKPCQVLQILKV